MRNSEELKGAGGIFTNLETTAIISSEVTMDSPLLTSSNVFIEGLKNMGAE
jgi:hypothetical protein